MHQVSFYCDEIQTAVEKLKAGGVEFTDGIKNAGYGLATHFRMPRYSEVELYQPHYKKRFPDEE